MAWKKLVVAVAIIRNKPSGASSKEFTEKLQKNLFISQSILHERYQQAKMQILHLQERLERSLPQNQGLDFPDIISMSQDNVSNGRITGQELSRCPVIQSCEKSYDFPTPPSSAKEVECASSTSHLSQDNGIETGSFQRSKECLTLHDCRYSANEFSGRETFNYHSDMNLHGNSRLIQSIVGLQGIVEQDLELTDKADLIEEAVRHIQTIADVITEDEVMISESCLCQAVENVTLMYRRYRWLEDKAAFMHGVCMLVESIIQRLIQPSGPGQFSDHKLKHTLISMLLVFMKGTSLALTSSIVDTLLESWEAFCQTLRSSQQSGDAVDPDNFEGGYYLVRCLELIVHMWHEDCCIPHIMLVEIQMRLETALTSITSHFPLVAQALLKVTSVIEALLSLEDVSDEHDERFHQDKGDGKQISVQVQPEYNGVLLVLLHEMQTHISKRLS